MKCGPMASSRVAIDISGVSVGNGSGRILEDVSFECFEGEWTVIHGPSGSGKSTLLRAINGLCALAGGRISVLDTQLPGRSRREACAVWRQTGTILQEIALFETKTALGNAALALRTVGFGRKAAREEAKKWLEHLGLGEKLNEYPSRLSGGQRQRVALARAFAVRPRLLILDEPTSALDRGTAQIVLETVRKLVDGGATVVMSSHRMDEVAGICDQQVELQGGRLLAIERREKVKVPAAREASALSSIPVPGRVSPGTGRHAAREQIRETDGNNNVAAAQSKGFVRDPHWRSPDPATKDFPNGTDNPSNIARG